MAKQVERLRAVVEALGLTHLHIGGNSMGGAIAAGYAARYPNDVASLWLVATAGVRSAPPADWAQALQRGEDNVLLPSTVEQYEALMGLVMARGPQLPAAFEAVYARRAVAEHALRAKQFRDLMASTQSLEEVVRGLPIPTHILWGDQDRILDVGAVDILRSILPNATSTVLPGIGHVPMIEAPKRSAQDYLSFRGIEGP